MTQDLASMTITQATEDEVMALFARLEQLLPGLLTLAVGDRKTLSIMGPTSERYVRLNIDLANQHAGLIPADMNLAGANADLEARERMMRIANRAKLFADKCEDTVAALGSDLMVFSHSCYAILKVLGKAVGLDDALKELSYRWARRKKKPATANEQ
ncbi:hypothetical protein [Noviluteimonas gilva]|uniref:Uncharacterized protein n=1 Tax=Noviluteimonas gilva TaxID=2682097 RepID=A0A7C9I019_9GAMM|nr:hypothetical protein [Lysobacter gilvus]MUV15194.1 hypothetical protein [Lysobacter gilvus]